MALGDTTGPVLSESDAALLDESGFVTDPAAAAAVRLDRDARMQDLVRRYLFGS
ncbi:UNVERIFIED_CONTAM: hypothetical protein DES50_102311 [Williamsia faeni]